MDDRPLLDVSLVCTVLNEVGSIDGLMRSIAAQTARPREVIVVDGGSRDGTQLHVEWWHSRLGCPLLLIEHAGANIAAGRNVGIAAARAPVIAVTDAGVALDPTWLERLVAPFADNDVAVCGGFFVPDARSAFEVAMGATVLPNIAEIAATTFLPSSRSVAFRKTAWEAVGGYPAWLDYCEDLVFDLALRDAGLTFAFAPDAVARFRPRGSLRAFWHQYFRYARGDGRARLWSKRHAIRYVAYSALPYVLVAARRHRWLFAILAACGSGYVWRPYRRLFENMSRLTAMERLPALALVPIIRIVGDAAKMCGYPVGVLWRVRMHGARWSWHASQDGGAPSLSAVDD